MLEKLMLDTDAWSTSSFVVSSSDDSGGLFSSVYCCCCCCSFSCSKTLNALNLSTGNFASGLLMQRFGITFSSFDFVPTRFDCNTLNAYKPWSIIWFSKEKKSFRIFRKTAKWKLFFSWSNCWSFKKFTKQKFEQSKHSEEITKHMR